MAKYRKKPVVVEARQFQTNNEQASPHMDQLVNWINQGRMASETAKPLAWHNGTDIYIRTLEGEMMARVGNWIIRGVNGEFYSCAADIFAATYEPA